jgi:hypothetical protein
MPGPPQRPSGVDLLLGAKQLGVAGAERPRRGQGGRPWCVLVAQWIADPRPQLPLRPTSHNVWPADRRSGT